MRGPNASDFIQSLASSGDGDGFYRFMPSLLLASSQNFARQKKNFQTLHEPLTTIRAKTTTKTTQCPRFQVIHTFRKSRLCTLAKLEHERGLSPSPHYWSCASSKHDPKNPIPCTVHQGKKFHMVQNKNSSQPTTTAGRNWCEKRRLITAAHSHTFRYRKAVPNVRRRSCKKVH